MSQPQQPELRRSGRSNTSQEAGHAQQEARGVPKEKGPGGPVPEENRPGHHPDMEQDQPSQREAAARRRPPGLLSRLARTLRLSRPDRDR